MEKPRITIQMAPEEVAELDRALAVLQAMAKKGGPRPTRTSLIREGALAYASELLAKSADEQKEKTTP